MTNVAPLSDRAVLRVAGAEARDFLQGLVTNDVAQLEPGEPLWAALLSAQGKYLFDMQLHAADDGAILVDTLASRAAELAKRLTLYKLRRAVEIAPTELKVFAAWDGESDAPYDPRLPGLGRRWVAEAATANATIEDYEMHPLALGVADSADYTVDKLMWLEANAEELNGVSFTKGCYVGQENTARMHHRDKLRKRLLPVLFAVEPGDDAGIRAGSVVAGELRSHRGGRGIAHMRLEHLDSQLTLGGAPTLVEWPTWLGERPVAA